MILNQSKIVANTIGNEGVQRNQVGGMSLSNPIGNHAMTEDMRHLG